MAFLHIAEGLLCVMQALYVLYKGNMPAVLALIRPACGPERLERNTGESTGRKANEFVPKRQRDVKG